MIIKTKLLTKLNLADYIDKINPALVPTEEEIDTAIRNSLLNKFIEMVNISENDAIQTGDSAVLKTVSALPKFNKASVKVSVGRNLYSKELEEALLGAHVGETISVTISGENVSATILEAKRKAPLPEVTDELVATSNHEHGKTVAELREYYRGMLNDVIVCVNTEIVPGIVQEAEFTPVHADDLAIVRQMRIDAIAEAIRSSNPDMEVTEDKVLKYVDTPDRDETSSYWLKSLLVSYGLLGIDSEEDRETDLHSEYLCSEKIAAYFTEEILKRRQNA